MEVSTRLQLFPRKVPAASRRLGTALIVFVTTYCLCGASGPQGCNSNQSLNVGPSKGEVTGAVVGALAVVAVGTVVLVEVHKSHHTVKGCVSVGPKGLEVTTDGERPKTYILDGPTGNIRVGDLVRFTGNRVKLTKDGSSDQTFQIRKIAKDYGLCKASATPGT